MNLLRTSSLRWQLRHPAQLALSVVGIALGVGVVVSIDLAIQSARRAFRASAETVAGQATHVVTGATGSIDEAVFPRVRVDLGIRSSAPVVEGLATSPALPGRVLRVLGVDAFSEAPFRAAWTAGSDAPDVADFLTRPRAVVLSSGTATDAGVAVGDSLPVLVDGRPDRLPVVGVVDPSDGLGAAGARDLLLMDIASAQELLGMAGRLTRIDLRLDGASQAGDVARIEALLPPDATVETAGTRTELMSGMIGAFDLNLTALSLLALVFGMFLIYNAMTFSVVQRRELLGSLRALGVTRREILGAVLTEAAALGLVGASLGAGLGVLLGRGLVRMVTRTINDLYFVVSVRELTVPWTTVAVGVVLGVVATVVAGTPPALEAASSPPRVARLRSVVEERARRGVRRNAALGLGLVALGAAWLWAPVRSVGASFAGLFLVVLGFALLTPAGTVGLVALARPVLTRFGGVLGTMAARGVVASLSRTGPAVAALVVAVSVTVGLGVMIESFRGTLGRWLEGTLRADVYVSLPSMLASRADGTLDPGIVEALRRHPDVVGASVYRGRELRLEDRLLRLVAVDLDPRGEAAFDFLDDAGPGTFDLFRDGRGALISEPLAWREELAVGDTLALPTPGGTVPLEVVGVFYDYGSDQGTVMLARNLLVSRLGDEGVTSLGLFVREGADAVAVTAELERTASEVSPQAVVVRTSSALREGSMAVFDRTFRVTAVLRLLAFVVAFVGVLSAFMALELERSREMGVLRATGLTPGQLWRLVTTQTGLLGMVAGLLSLPLGIVLSVVMIEVVNRRSFGWSLRMGVPGTVLVQAVGLAVVGSLLAGLVPAWRMARTSPGSAMRGE